MERSVRGGGGARVGKDQAPLPLPPPPRLAAAAAAAASSSPAASIRAHLARAAGVNGGADCQSPRSLLSRILLRGDGGGGGGGGGFGCRVRLPRRYGSGSSGGGKEEEKNGGGEQAETARVKLVGMAPELPLETPRSSLGKKKPEEELMSMNLGLGASLVLLLSKSAVELNKMVELRAQMAALVSEIRKETTASHKNSASTAAASSSSQESNGSTTTTTVKDSIAYAAAEDTLSNCSRTAAAGGRTVVVMDQMEAELQVELSRLQCNRIPPVQGLEVKTKSTYVSDGTSRSCVAVAGDDKEGDVEDEGNNDGEVVDEEEEEEEEEEYEDEEEGYGGGEKSPPHGGVSARALERRLHEVLQKRQQERIVELQSALDSAQRRLHEKEREVVWWRDAAKLVSHRRDETRRLAR